MSRWISSPRVRTCGQRYLCQRYKNVERPVSVQIMTMGLDEITTELRVIAPLDISGFTRPGCCCVRGLRQLKVMVFKADIIIDNRGVAGEILIRRWRGGGDAPGGASILLTDERGNPSRAFATQVICSSVLGCCCSDRDEAGRDDLARASDKYRIRYVVLYHVVARLAFARSGRAQCSSGGVRETRKSSQTCVYGDSWFARSRSRRRHTDGARRACRPTSSPLTTRARRALSAPAR